jgi:hypothetical protein
MNHLDMRRIPYLCVGKIQGITWYSTMKFLPSLSVVASKMVALLQYWKILMHQGFGKVEEIIWKLSEGLKDDENVQSLECMCSTAFWSCGVHSRFRLLATSDFSSPVGSVFSGRAQVGLSVS